MMRMNDPNRACVTDEVPGETNRSGPTGVKGEVILVVEDEEMLRDFLRNHQLSISVFGKGEPFYPHHRNSWLKRTMDARQYFISSCSKSEQIRFEHQLLPMMAELSTEVPLRGKSKLSLDR